MANTKHGEVLDFWEIHRRELYQFVLRRVSDPEIAEDIVQDVITVGFAKLESLQDTRKLRAWLYQITRNTIIDHYRKRRPQEDLPDDLPAIEDGEPLPLDELTCCIQPFINQLPDPYRSAIQMSEIEGLTQGEIAKREGISVSGAKSRVQRGRKLLKSLLLQCCAVEMGRRGDVIHVETRGDCEGCG